MRITSHLNVTVCNFIAAKRKRFLFMLRTLWNLWFELGERAKYAVDCHGCGTYGTTTIIKSK